MYPEVYLGSLRSPDLRVVARVRQILHCFTNLKSSLHRSENRAHVFFRGHRNDTIFDISDILITTLVTRVQM